MSCPLGKYDFSVTPFDKSSYCGSSKQGGSNCKVECCLAQDQYCYDACLTNKDCVQHCLEERGCQDQSNGNHSDTDSGSDGDDTDDDDGDGGGDIVEDGGDATEIVEEILEGLAGLA